MKKIIVLFLLVLCLLLSSCDRADLITFQWEDFLLDCLGSDWCPDNFVGSRWECQEIDFWFEVIEDTVDVTADDASVGIYHEGSVAAFADGAYLALRYSLHVFGIAKLVEELCLGVVA